MSCKFARGEFLRCPGSNDRWISTGGALRKFSDAGLKEFNRLRPASNGGSRQVACADIKACKVGEPATTANMTSTLAHWDAAHPTTAPSNPATGTSAPAQTQAPAAAQGTCNFEKGVIVAYAGVGPDVDWYMFESTNRMWLLPRDIRSQVQARRPGFVPTIASRADIDSCTQRPAANPKDIDEVLLLLDAGPMQGFTRPAATSAPTTSPWSTSAPQSCNFEKGALLQCMGEAEDWYLFDGSKTWTIQGADAKAALVQSRPGLKPTQTSCAQISSCPWRGVAAPSDMTEMLALIDAGPAMRPKTLAPGPTCQPRTTGAPVLPVCTEAPTDFEKTTCNAAGGKLVARDMYGQTFAYCVFPNGTSCQVDDIASGWCSAPTQAPLTQAPTPAPAAQQPPWMQQAPSNDRQNQLLGLLPSLFGGAGSDVPGNDTSSGGGGSGLGFATVGADGAAAGTDPSAVTNFFGDQTGQANTGVTSDIVANLGQQQQYDTSGNDRVPQPVPVVMPNTTPQGPAVGGEGTVTPAPMGATSGEEAALAQIQSILAAKTAAPATDETSFFRLKNPIMWIIIAALIAIVFIIYKKYSLSKTAAAQSASA